ncbi:hypothetical protein [Microbacterium oxydans]|jgi:hypothetical protein|uniref:hypothetical protein n=1 Tax=Microbacterium oxydans TaxID=82380 RepID=UPI00226B9E22|nr:hypothetical protein [Microbacterium oxydans]WAA66523.1 hypothetical protein MME74_01910 [Microbacterium oxydans]
MFEHPYFTQQIAAHEQQQIERAAERRRFLAEHADRIVPRSEGAVRRMLRRVLRGSGRTRGAASGRESSGCEPIAAPAR